MTWNIFKFELKYHFQSPLFYILFIIFFFMAFGGVTTDQIQIGGAVGNVNRNAPFVIMQFLLIFSTFGVLVATAYVASAIHRDFEMNTDSLFFSSPLKKFQYLAGRFSAAFLVSSFVYFGVLLAIMVGSKMPWLDKERIGLFLWQPYVYSYFVLILPNLLLFAAIFFTVAALTRSMLTTYVGVAAFYVGFVVSRRLMSNLENESLKSLLDPFGLSAFFLDTRYWSVFEKNHNVLALQGAFLWNRVLWISIALVVLAFTFWKFRMEIGGVSGKAKKLTLGEVLLTDRVALALPRVTQQFGGGASWRQFWTALRMECRAILRSIPFLVILLLGMLNTLGVAVGTNRLFGTSIHPVTHVMLEAINGGFVIFSIIIAAFYSGEIVWRERALKMNEVQDAMPAPTWAIWAGKFTALVIMLYLTLAMAVLMTIGYQTVRGYHNYELGVYAKGVFLVIGINMIMFAALTFFSQIIFNNRYIGFVAALLYIISLTALQALHFEHRLYQIFNLPDPTYSDMNGYGHFAQPFAWFASYWLIFGAMLFVVGHLFWVRGTETSLGIRRRIARQRFTKPAIATLTLFTLAFAASGCYIYYNTNVLNRYETSDQREKRAAETEKLYKRYDRLAQPRITDAQADVDIYPEKRWVDVRCTYTLVNKTAQPIGDLHVVMDPDVDSTITIPGAKVATADKVHGYTIYRLSQPLAPGATLPMSFTVKAHHAGFQNESRDNTIVANGTFVNNFALFPHLGYQNFGELQEAHKRRKYGLPPVIRLAKIDDKRAQMDNEISREADWINLDTTVSTSPDQIALAPGYLQREWTQNGRRYFRYKTTSPILAFWSYLSARYEVKRDQWHGIPIEVYYDKLHPYNVDRMIYAVKKSLDYFTTNFSRYQHKQVRILEFPLYSRFAQSFPNTIPFSESIGFIADLRDKDDIDYPFYVTAHEVGHQWWAHQVIGADVQGTTMITETLAQYSALMVMEHEYGRDKMKRFLRFELNRYLGGRGGEVVAEMPLGLVENQQYIHYGKGSLAMYELRDQIGEENVNAALRKFIKDRAFAQPPYPTTRELVADFRAMTPADKQQVITDLFETITLYDNKTTEASVKPAGGGKYEVTFTVQAKKMRSNGAGAESPIAFNDWVDIGIFGDGGNSKTHDDKVLFLEKRHITQPLTTITLTVPGKPTRAGIDPFNKLIDRNPDDNTKKL